MKKQIPKKRTFQKPVLLYKKMLKFSTFFIKTPQILILSSKLVLPYPANRAYPILFYIFPGRVGRDSVFRIAYSRIIDITTNFTNVFYHNFSPFEYFLKLMRGAGGDFALNNTMIIIIGQCFSVTLQYAGICYFPDENRMRIQVQRLFYFRFHK